MNKLPYEEMITNIRTVYLFVYLTLGYLITWYVRKYISSLTVSLFCHISYCIFHIYHQHQYLRNTCFNNLLIFINILQHSGN
jgi:hypothetical protein